MRLQQNRLAYFAFFTIYYCLKPLYTTLNRNAKENGNHSFLVREERYMSERRTIRKKLVAAAAAAVAVAGIGAASVTIIPTGYTGVRTTFGQVSQNTIPSGFSLKIPLVQSVERVNNKQQDIIFSDKVWSETQQRTAIYYSDVTVTYQINPEKSAWIYSHVTNYKDNLVSSFEQ